MKNRLEELRKQRAIRQEDLAQALGVSRQTVISLEKGKYNPSLALAFKLARYFGLPIEAIFDDSDVSTAAITNLAPHSGADIGL